MLAALQAVPEAAPESDTPQCDLKHPDVVPCTVIEPIVYLPAMMLRLPALADLGGDSIRVTMTPSLGGRGELYQVTLDPHGRASLLAVWVVGHPYSGWREIAREEVVLTGRDYHRLAAQVDAALAQPDPPTGDVICLDGPGMYTERNQGGPTRRYEAWGCGGEASNVAFYTVAAFACRQIGRDAPDASIRPLCDYRIRFARESR